MDAKDLRLKMMNEVLNGIKVGNCDRNLCNSSSREQLEIA